MLYSYAGDKITTNRMNILIDRIDKSKILILT